MKYIDADKVWGEAIKRFEYVDDFAEVLEAVPTEDVRENTHGEWKLMESDWDDNTWQCSVCGEPFVLIEGEPDQNGYYFCPNCGADMRGE